jgi:uncharacterized membrane protein YgdD (TMEM256/DUF423 family)
MNPRFPLQAAGLFGVTGVALGAFGAHALHSFLATQGTLGTWETAVHYQLLHAVALLGAAAWLRLGEGRAMAWAVRAWSAGIMLFSGSLYLLALGGPRWLGPVTPLGGLGLVAGWLCVAAAASPDKKHEP